MWTAFKKRRERLSPRWVDLRMEIYDRLDANRKRDLYRITVDELTSSILIVDAVVVMLSLAVSAFVIGLLLGGAC